MTNKDGQGNVHAPTCVKIVKLLNLVKVVINLFKIVNLVKPKSPVIVMIQSEYFETVASTKPKVWR